MDASVALERFRTKHSAILAEIAERGTLLDEADINELLQLSLPGLDEVMALFELSELDRAGTYTRIIVDTAPSGHTSRLLRLPEVFKRMVTALDRMGDKHRYIVAHFARRGAVVDRVDLFLRDLNERIGRVRTLLFDNSQTSFVLVAIPEAMSVRETERYRALLRHQGVPVRDLIVNRVEERHSDCEYCKARLASQQPWLEEMSHIFRDLQFHRVPLLSREVRGLQSLQLVGKVIWKGERAREIGKSGSKKPPKTKPAAKVASDFPLYSRRIFIFGGKGGVGKTTAAAAFALVQARSDRQRKFLIFSTDPAHSLSDSFGMKVGEKRSDVAGNTNLDAMEIDPGKWFEDLKQRYRSWTDQLFASIAGSSRLEIKFDREAMRELVELTPPGIDEIAALGVISELLDNGKYDIIILDTAPTGHLVRFLELPEVALSWVRTFMKLLLKYQHVVQANRVAEELIALSKSLKRVLAILTDATLCEFVGVAIPERMSLEETKDLAKALQGLKVPFRRLLINGLIPAEAAAGCQFCHLRRASQLSVLQAFRRQFGRTVNLFVAPQQDREIYGPIELRRHFSNWSSLNAQGPVEGRLRSSAAAVKNVRRPRARK
jgi:arsenite-transporting ATPase